MYVLRDDEEEAAKIEAHDLKGTAEVPLISREATGLMLWVPLSSGTMHGIVIDEFLLDGDDNSMNVLYAIYSGDASLLSTPAIGNDLTIYAASPDKIYFWVDPSKNTFDELYPTDDRDVSPAPFPIPPMMDFDNSLMFVGGNQAVRLNSFLVGPDGSPIWKWNFDSDYPSGLTYYSAPALDADGNVYLLASDDAGDLWLMVIGPDTAGPFLNHGGVNGWFLEHTVLAAGDRVYLVFDEPIVTSDDTPLPKPADFEVKDHGVEVAVKDVYLYEGNIDSLWPDRHQGSVLVLELEQPVLNGQQVTVKYKGSSEGFLIDREGNSTAPFELTAFDATRPDVIEEEVFSQGNTVTLTFDEEVSYNFSSNPLYADRLHELRVLVNDKEAEITNVTASGNKVIITLKSMLKASDKVRVQYSPAVGSDPFAYFWYLSDASNLIRDKSTVEYSGLFGGNIAKDFDFDNVRVQPPSSGGTRPGGGSGGEQPGEQRGEDQDRRVKTLIPVPMLEEWRARYPNGVIYGETPQAAYILPLSAMAPDALEWTPDAKQPLGEDEELYVMLTISAVEGETLEALQAAADGADLDMIGDAIEFKLQIVKDDKDIGWTPFGELIPDISDREDLKFFEGYIRRSIFLSGEADAGHTVAVYYDSSNGELYPVPTKLLDADDGKIEVRFQRPGFSIYAIVTEDKSFVDVAGHWAEKEIHRLANKWLARGRTEDRYFPNEAITRAEFTALLVRALGLQGLGGHLQLPYEDVRETAWYYRDLKAAVQYGLVREESAKFRPDDPILRRDMMIMLSRAYKAIGEWRPVDADQVLSRYEDAGRVPAELRQIIAGLVDRGVIVGMGPVQLAPDAYATRAEAAAVIRRFLSSVDYM